MKFDAEDPSEMSKSKQTAVDRSQGAARAISVSIPTRIHVSVLTYAFSLLLIQVSIGVILYGLKESQTVWISLDVFRRLINQI